MTNITVCTTFPSTSWNVYSKAMLQSFVANWPADVPLLIELDDDLILDGVRSQARECDAVAAGWLSDHAAFVARNKDKEDPQNYRKQAVRFCHKVFTLHRAMQAVQEQPAPKPRYLIWMDGDVVTNRKITHEDLALCLPKDGDAVSYLGRKDWPHSECGWLAFDLENGGGDVIKAMHTQYVTDGIFQFKQWDDSWVFDEIRKVGLQKFTNLTDGKPGMEIWPHSPMGKWSTHYKGPVAKQKLGNAQPRPPHPNPTGKVIINTRNALPNETLQAHISRNQELIKNWISFCKPTDEQIVMVSAGPQLIAEEVRAETGKKIVAVKHALTPLKKAGITPWACILLDPRPHVADFIKDADPAVLWFVASQVNPEVTIQLLAKGCTVWGYHAAVNAGEEHLTAKQPGAVVSGAEGEEIRLVGSGVDHGRESVAPTLGPGLFTSHATSAA